MDTRKALIALIVIVFLGGGYWYYLQTRQAPQIAPGGVAPFVSPTRSAGGGAMQLPTSVPHVTGPTTSPPVKSSP